MLGEEDDAGMPTAEQMPIAKRRHTIPRDYVEHRATYKIMERTENAFRQH